MRIRAFEAEVSVWVKIERCEKRCVVHLGSHTVSIGRNIKEVGSYGHKYIEATGGGRPLLLS